MKPKRPYLLRAMYKWLVDCESVPHIVVDTQVGICDVPEEHINEHGKIILNISPTAAQNLEIDNDRVMFFARFKGEPCSVNVPTGSVICIYDRDTGTGMTFGDAELTEEPEPEPIDPTLKPTKHPHLQVVK